MRWIAFLALVLSLLVGAPGALWARDSEKPAAKKRRRRARSIASRRTPPDPGRTGSAMTETRAQRPQAGTGRHDGDCDDDDDFAARSSSNSGGRRITRPSTGAWEAWRGCRAPRPGSGRASSLRAVGEPLIPFVSVDGQMQDVGGDVSASRGPRRSGLRSVRLRVPRDRVSRAPPRGRDDDHAGALPLPHVVLAFVEVDLGYGYATLSGDRSTTGPSLTTPLRVYPTPALGFELRPSWAWMGGNTITDCSLLAVARRSVVSIKAGYRWTSTGNVDLNGPVIGVAVNF